MRYGTPAMPTTEGENEDGKPVVVNEYGSEKVSVISNSPDIRYLA
jgi:hypothetical protein